MPTSREFSRCELRFGSPWLQARRSVSDADMAKYSSFAATMQQQRSNLGGGMGAANFRFPRAAGSGGASASAADAADDEDLYS